MFPPTIQSLVLAVWLLAVVSGSLEVKRKVPLPTGTLGVSATLALETNSDGMSRQSNLFVAASNSTLYMISGNDNSPLASPLVLSIEKKIWFGSNLGKDTLVFAGEESVAYFVRWDTNVSKLSLLSRVDLSNYIRPKSMGACYYCAENNTLYFTSGNAIEAFTLKISVRDVQVTHLASFPLPLKQEIPFYITYDEHRNSIWLASLVTESANTTMASLIRMNPNTGEILGQAFLKALSDAWHVVAPLHDPYVYVVGSKGAYSFFCNLTAGIDACNLAQAQPAFSVTDPITEIGCSGSNEDNHYFFALSGNTWFQIWLKTGLGKIAAKLYGFQTGVTRDGNPHSCATLGGSVALSANFLNGGSMVLLLKM